MPAEHEAPVARVISAVEARQSFEEILDEARFRGSRFVVERDGKPMAVVVGIEEWENIAETLKELNDPEYLDSIREARTDIRLGKGISLAELKAEFAKTRKHGL